MIILYYTKAKHHALFIVLAAAERAREALSVSGIQDVRDAVLLQVGSGMRSLQEAKEYGLYHWSAPR